MAGEVLRKLMLFIGQLEMKKAEVFEIENNLYNY